VELTWWPSKDNGRPVTHYIVEIFNINEGYWKRQEDAPSQCLLDSIMSAVCIRINIVSLDSYRIPSVHEHLFECQKHIDVFLGNCTLFRQSNGMSLTSILSFFVHMDVGVLHCS